MQSLLCHCSKCPNRGINKGIAISILHINSWNMLRHFLFSIIRNCNMTNHCTHTRNANTLNQGSVWFISRLQPTDTWQLLSFSSIYFPPSSPRSLVSKTPIQVFPAPSPFVLPPSLLLGLMGPWIIPSCPSNSPMPPSHRSHPNFPNPSSFPLTIW